MFEELKPAPKRLMGFSSSGFAVVGSFLMGEIPKMSLKLGFEILILGVIAFI